jgi:predicted MFS family arabinose efflux permease
VFGLLVISMSQTYGALMFGRVFVGLGVGFGLAVSDKKGSLDFPSLTLSLF